MVKVLSVTIPAALIGIFVAATVEGRVGRDLDEDPEYQARLADGRVQPVDDTPADSLTYTTIGRNAAFIFLAAVAGIIIFGLFPDLRPTMAAEGGGTEPIAVTPIIEMLMFTAAGLMILFCKPDAKEIPESSVFKAGIVSAVALFGLAWLTDTFIGAWETQIVDVVGGWVNSFEAIFFFGVFLVAALTTSQSTATRTIVPIGLASGLSPAVISGMWAGGFAGVFTLPTNGSQIAAANFDQTGGTRLGTKLVDHSFIIPVIVMGIVTAASGAIIGNLLY
jgi:anaerobic C4-dicarboxylate transporter DcuA/anaerobic C4-dicarboxylate transporter DcuB